MMTHGATSEEITRGAAEADAKAYAYNLRRYGGETCCEVIEQAWGLEGYPPEIVTGTLCGIAEGMTFDEALADALDEMANR